MDGQNLQKNHQKQGTSDLNLANTAHIITIGLLTWIWNNTISEEIHFA